METVACSWTLQEETYLTRRVSSVSHDDIVQSLTSEFSIRMETRLRLSYPQVHSVLVSSPPERILMIMYKNRNILSERHAAAIKPAQKIDKFLDAKLIVINPHIHPGTTVTIRANSSKEAHSDHVRVDCSFSLRATTTPTNKGTINNDNAPISGAFHSILTPKILVSPLAMINTRK